MPIPTQLLNEIRAGLGNVMPPSLTTASRADDIFEAYIFTLVCRAAKEEGATVSYRSISSTHPPVFIFRTSPCYITTRTKDFGYALIQFPKGLTFEAHVGIYISGESKVSHESDICVLKHEVASALRNSNINRAVPPHTSAIISVEAKSYGTNIGLHLGREFLGLRSDLPRTNTFFVMNRTQSSIERLLAYKKQKWEHNIQPHNKKEIDRLKNAFQEVFKRLVTID